MLHKRALTGHVPDKDLIVIKINQDKTELKLIFRGSKNPEEYEIKPKTEHPEDRLPLGLVRDWDIQHKPGTVEPIYKDDDCTCGIKRMHAHCSVCGRVLKLGKPKR